MAFSIVVRTLLLTLSVGVVAQANAHHAQAPFFDQDRTVEVSGTVLRWVFRNPHPVLEVETTNEQGAKVVWAVQFAPATVLAKRGWTDRTFKPGDTVIATGHPSRAAGTFGLEHRDIRRGDGSPVVAAPAGN